MGSERKYLRVAEAARYVGLTVNSLYCYRSRGVGPRSMKVGGRVLYRRADLDDWVERNAAVLEGGPTAAARA